MTIAIGLLGGIIVEPDSYHFPHDIGSGKMWKFFVGGMVLTISPLGSSRGFDDGAKDGDHELSGNEVQPVELNGEIARTAEIHYASCSQINDLAETLVAHDCFGASGRHHGSDLHGHR